MWLTPEQVKQQHPLIYILFFTSKDVLPMPQRSDYTDIADYWREMGLYLKSKQLHAKAVDNRLH